MDDSFYDIEIPRRPSECGRPDDFSIHFAFIRERELLRLDIHGGEMPLEYMGKGRVVMPDGFFRVPALSQLDPFMNEKRFIPSKFFKIFFRVYLPRFLDADFPVSSDLYMDKTPALSITVDAEDKDNASYALRWNAPRGSLLFPEGFDGFAVCGDVCRPAPKHIINSLSHLDDGVYPLPKAELERFRGFYRDAPYMFSVKGGSFTPAPLDAFSIPPREIREMERPAKKPTRRQEIIQQSFALSLDLENVPAKSAPKSPVSVPSVEKTASVPPAPVKQTELSGPALLSFSHTANARAENGKFTFFLVEAKRFSDYAEANAEFVPFTCYWPVYAKMSREQRAWYFHWRGEFRKGNILRTDLSYIFVYIYELINRCYGTAQDGLSELKALWRAYRRDFPRLDYYMPAYCADFMLVNGLEAQLGSIAEEFSIESVSMRPFAELYLNDKLKEGLHALPYDILSSLSDYNFKGSRFYKQCEDLCRDTVMEVFAELDRAMRASQNKNLLEAFSPPPVDAKWNAYSGAVCGRSASRQINVRYIPFTSSPELREFIGAVFKHTENTLRKREKYAGRLRGYTLSPQVQTLIERVCGASPSAVTPAAPAQEAKPVEIDLALARDLELSSWENTKKLIDAVDKAQENAEDIFAEQNLIPPLSAPAAVSAPEESTEEIADYSDVYKAYLASLSAFQREFLCAIADGEDEAALSQRASRELTFNEAVFEELNALAQDYIGDIILDPVDGSIYEEHLSSLKDAINS